MPDVNHESSPIEDLLITQPLNIVPMLAGPWPHRYVTLRQAEYETAKARALLGRYLYRGTRRRHAHI
jgi:hypothetical protein